MFPLQGDDAMGAAELLALTGDTRAVEPLIDALERSYFVTIGPGGIDRSARGTREYERLHEVIMAMGCLGDPRCREPLERVIKRTNPREVSTDHVRIHFKAKRALAMLGPSA
jgi:hypothetical protein